MRKLASVQYVHEVVPIEGADRLELVKILGWQCVVPKGEFKTGDLAVYMEVDSFLPVCDKFEFLRKASFKKSEILGDGFHLKTIKLRGQISQGLVQPLNILPSKETGEWSIGDDVTDILGIRKWVIEERVGSDGTVIGEFPSFASKSDEMRVQSYPELIEEMKTAGEYYISTKMDGTSVTMYKKDGKFGVCSRNYEYADDGKSSAWKYAHEHNIPELLDTFDIDNIILQGEFCGAGIQQNHLKLVKPEWYIFSIYNADTGRRYGLEQMKEICTQLSLNMVPIEETASEFKYNTVDELINRAKGKYSSGCAKEGIVIRPVNPVYSKALRTSLSFKVINNDYLVKYSDIT